MNNTMTIKELAEVAGCNEKTIRRALKNNFPTLLKQGRTTRFTKEEAFDVIAKLPHKNDFGQVRTTGGKVVRSGNSAKNSTVGGQVKTIAQTVIETLIEMGIIVKPLIAPTRPLVALPSMDVRAEINKIVREYSTATKVPIQNLWNQLYHEALYRMRRNYKLLAENKNISAIQACADDNRLDELLAITKHIFDIEKLKSSERFVQELEEMKI